MKTDKLFYRIFLSQPELITELLSGIPADCEFEYSTASCEGEGSAAGWLVDAIVG